MFEAFPRAHLEKTRTYTAPQLFAHHIICQTDHKQRNNIEKSKDSNAEDKPKHVMREELHAESTILVAFIGHNKSGNVDFW